MTSQLFNYYELDSYKEYDNKKREILKELHDFTFNKVPEKEKKIQIKELYQLKNKYSGKNAYLGFTLANYEI